MICTLTDLCIYYIMSGDIAAQGFRQVCADFKRSQVIRQALKRLKPRDRDLLEMKYFSQLDDKKISQQLRISRNSVRYYLTLARRALKLMAFMRLRWNIQH